MTMDILHLATFLQGGAGRVIADLACAQAEAGHRVTVVASRTGAPGYGNYDAYFDQLRAAGVEAHLVDSMFLRDYASNARVVRALEAMTPPGREPDIIHAHAAVPGLVGVLFAALRHRPIGVLQTMHGWGIVKTASQAAMDVRVMHMVNRVVVPSQHAADQMRQFGLPAERVTVLPYGVGRAAIRLDADDVRLRNEIRHARRSGALVLACVGTIVPRKNQRLLLEAMARLHPRTRVLTAFIGDGDTDDLQRLTLELGLADRVRYRGYTPAARVLAASANALVLPSRSEGQPLAILEAFADDLLVVSSDVPELSELVDDGRTGLTFASEDAAALAAAIERLASMPERARRVLRRRARAIHARRFTLAAMTRRYDAAYREVAAAARAVPRDIAAA